MVVPGDPVRRHGYTMELVTTMQRGAISFIDLAGGGRLAVDVCDASASHGQALAPQGKRSRTTNDGVGRAATLKPSKRSPR